MNLRQQQQKRNTRTEQINIRKELNPLRLMKFRHESRRVAINVKTALVAAEAHPAERQ
jgi:hypothetical protein